MGVIPTIETRTMPNAQPNFGRVSAGSIGEGLSRLGATMANVAARGLQEQMTREEQDQATQENAFAAQFRSQQMDWIEQQKAQAPADPTGFTDSIVKQYADTERKALEDPSLSDYQRKLRSRMLADVGETVHAHALAYESNAKQSYRQAAVESSLNTLANVAARDASQYDSIYQQGLATIRESGMNATDALKLENDWKSNAVKSMLLGQIERTPSSVIKTLDAGTYDDRLDANSRATLYNAAEASVRQRAAEARANTVSAMTALKGAESRMEAGIALPADEMSMIEDIVKSSGNTKINTTWEQMKTSQTVMQKAAQVSPRELDGMISTMSKAVNTDGGTAQEFSLLKSLTTLKNNMQTQINTDPLTFAARAGVADVQPLDFSSSDAFRQSLVQRSVTAAKVASQFEAAPKVLTEGEAMSFTTEFSRATPQEKLAMSVALRDSLPALQRTAFLQQIGEKSPALSYVMAMPDEMTSGKLSAFRGFELLKENPDLVKKSEFTPLFQSAVSDALQGFSPKIQSQISDAVRAVVADKVSRGQVLSDDLIDESVTAAVGSIANVNGSSIILPRGVKETDFERAIGQIQDDTLSSLSASGKPPVDDRGKPLLAKQIKNLMPVSLGDGLYGFRSGPDDIVYDADGIPYGLKLDQDAISKLVANYKPQAFSAGNMGVYP